MTTHCIFQQCACLPHASDAYGEGKHLSEDPGVEASWSEMANKARITGERFRKAWGCMPLSSPQKMLWISPDYRIFSTFWGGHGQFHSSNSADIAKHHPGISKRLDISSGFSFTKLSGQDEDQSLIDSQAPLRYFKLIFKDFHMKI